MAQNLKRLFGQQLKARRLAAGMSQEGLAERCGCSVETISFIERGIHGPRFELLERLSLVLRCRPKDLFDF